MNQVHLFIVCFAYWSEGQDISTDEVLIECCKEIGLKPEVVARASDPDVKAQLQAATDEAISNGVFGAPTSIVNGHLFWGQDRLDMVKHWAVGCRRVSISNVKTVLRYCPK